MITVILIILLLVAIVILSWYLYDCKNPGNDGNDETIETPGLPFKKDPDHRLSLEDYHEEKSKKFGSILEPYTLADYSKVQRCRCGFENCNQHTGSRDWMPSTYII